MDVVRLGDDSDIGRNGDRRRVTSLCYWSVRSRLLVGSHYNRYSNDLTWRLECGGAALHGCGERKRQFDIKAVVT